MKNYKDLNNDSNILKYEYWDDYISIVFKKWEIYTYNYQSAWKDNIEQMKKLADIWDWLLSFIMRNKIKHSAKS